MSVVISRAIKRSILAALSLIVGITSSGCGSGGGSHINPAPMYGPGVMYGPPNPVPMYGVVASAVRGPSHLEIHGKITKSDGTPLPGVHVLVKETTLDNQWPEVITDAGGEYYFSTAPFAGGEAITITASDTEDTDVSPASKTIEVPKLADGANSSLNIDFTLDPKP